MSEVHCELPCNTLKFLVMPEVCSIDDPYRTRAGVLPKSGPDYESGQTSKDI